MTHQGRIVQSWISAKFEFRYDSLQSKFQFNYFCLQFDDWMLYKE